MKQIVQAPAIRVQESYQITTAGFAFAEDRRFQFHVAHFLQAVESIRRLLNVQNTALRAQWGGWTRVQEQKQQKRL